MTSVYFAITLRELYASSKPTLHDLHQSKSSLTLHRVTVSTTWTYELAMCTYGVLQEVLTQINRCPVTEPTPRSLDVRFDRF